MLLSIQDVFGKKKTVGSVSGTLKAGLGDPARAAAAAAVAAIMIGAPGQPGSGCPPTVGRSSQSCAHGNRLRLVDGLRLVDHPPSVNKFNLSFSRLTFFFLTSGPDRQTAAARPGGWTVTVTGHSR